MRDEEAEPQAPPVMRTVPRPLPRGGHRTTTGSPSRDPRRPVLLAATVLAAALALGGLVAGWLMVRPGARPTVGARDDPAPADETAADPPVAEPRSKPPCPGAATAVPAGAVAVVGDPEGTGCTVTVIWWPDRAEAERPEVSGAHTRFSLGEPGDQLVLGDWDGDGRDTPALYDPIRGDVIWFGGWAAPGETLEGTVQPGIPVPAGLATVSHGAHQDRVEVHPGP